MSSSYRFVRTPGTSSEGVWAGSSPRNLSRYLMRISISLEAKGLPGSKPLSSQLPEPATDRIHDRASESREPGKTVSEFEIGDMGMVMSADDFFALCECSLRTAIREIAGREGVDEADMTVHAHFCDLNAPGQAAYLPQEHFETPALEVNSNYQAAALQALKGTIFGGIVKPLIRDGYLPNRVKVRDRSSGNLPLCFPGHSISSVKQAAAQSLLSAGGLAYNQELEKARKIVAGFYGVPPDCVFFTAGISGGIVSLHQTLLEGPNNHDARMLIPNCSYPTHFSSAIMAAGLGSILTIGRDSMGLPMLSGFNGKNNPFRDASFSTFIPHDNPISVVLPPEVYTNVHGTGIFDLNCAAQQSDGRLRPIVLDHIYDDLWPGNKMRQNDLIRLNGGRNVLIFMNSLSKVFLLPGLRAGVTVVYIPEHWQHDQRWQVMRSTLLKSFNSLSDLFLTQTGTPSLTALARAYDILRDEREGIVDVDLERVRGLVKARFIGEDGKSGSHAIMTGIRHIQPLFPDVKIETSCYEMFEVTGRDLPWKDNAYKNNVLDRLEAMILTMDENNLGKQSALDSLRYLRATTPVEEISASDIFAIDLVMETGVAVAPGDRFYKLGTAPAKVMFRTVMVFSEAEMRKDAQLVEKFLIKRLG